MKENADKARGLDALEIAKQLREGAEQIFRIRFQMRMGQADGLKKLRLLRKERARMLTVQHERELEKAETSAPAALAPAVTAKKSAAQKVVAKKAVAQAVARKVVAKKAAAKPAKKAAAQTSSDKKASAKKNAAKAKG
jgi:large subunit ribosomal protein L29